MSELRTIDSLFDFAIRLEESARQVYLALAGRCAHLPAAAAFWQQMARDEERHAADLKAMRDSLTAEQLQGVPAPSLRGRAQRLSGLIAGDPLLGVRTLDDAYALARRLEDSEVNTLYDVLMTRFVGAARKEKLIVSQITEHTLRLVEFARLFGEEEERKRIEL